jgi:hypothetical protein
MATNKLDPFKAMISLYPPNLSGLGDNAPSLPIRELLVSWNNTCDHVCKLPPSWDQLG